MNITFIGSGNVGSALANKLQIAGHEVSLATRQSFSESIVKAQQLNSQLKAMPIEQAIKAAEIVFIATPFSAIREIISPLAELLTNKIVVDCTNPVGPGLTHGLNSLESGTQFLQSLAPQAKVVKAFTIYGFENFEEIPFKNLYTKPAMLFCGDSTAAKNTVAKIIEQLGWEALDVGGINQALHLEHLTLLWIKMVRLNGHSPDLMWSVVKSKSIPIHTN